MLRKKRGSTLKAAGYAVVVHLVLAAFLFVGFRWYDKDPADHAVPVVKATVVNDEQAKREIARVRQEERAAEEAQKQAERRQAEELRLADQKRKQEDEQRRVEAAKKVEAEKRRIAAAEAEKKRLQAERQRAEIEKKREAAEAEKKRLAAEAEKKRQAAEAEKKRLAELERERQEEERRRREAEKSLQDQLAAEERQREAALAARAQSEAERYKVLIRQKVERNWVRPGGTLQGLSCVVRVRVVPGGEVTEARVVRSSGNPVYDRSVESAVFKASPLPLPSEQALFDYFRELEFTFNPQG